MSVNEQSRDAFEDWARNKPNAPAYFGRSNGGYYIEDDVCALWEGWQAGRDSLAESHARLLVSVKELRDALEAEGSGYAWDRVDRADSAIAAAQPFAEK